MNTPSAPTPTPSDAISAFIKSVRLRYPTESIKWLTYLWQQPKERPRVQRRILLISGEDNISVGVTEMVSDWYGSPSRKSIEAAATEVLRIIETKNWYAQPDGREYIYSWRIAELSPPDFSGASLNDLFEIMGKAVKDHDLIRGLAAFNAAYERRDFRAQHLASHLMEWARESGNQQANRLAHVFSKNASTLWTDGNISGQAYYALIHGEFGEQRVPEINSETATQLIDQAIEKLQGPIEAPSYARDGIHTKSGSEKRFSGVVRHMAAASRAFEHFGRLDPSDQWLPEFYDAPTIDIPNLR